MRLKFIINKPIGGITSVVNLRRKDIFEVSYSHKTIWRAWLALLFALLTPAIAQAQSICDNRASSDLNFQNPTLESGVPLTVGAIYRFPSVTPGVDARVRIDALTNATLTIIDRDTGLVNNFQPELAGTNARSADFTITLVTAGTTTPIALDFTSSAIDIDGDGGTTREYAEFSTGYASYILDSPSRLSVNASGPSSATRTRFESTTNFTAPGIDPTATQNIVSVIYTGTSSFSYRIGTLGAGTVLRLTSLAFTCQPFVAPTPTTVVAQDYGDAPASYGNPRHDIVTGIRLGATNTTEAGPYNNANAVGDTGDDGVTISQLRHNRASNITVTVAGTGGRLQGWIDWNGDGDFADAGEQIATNVADNGAGDTNAATGSIVISVTPPVTAVLTQTFARFRWTTQSNIGLTLTAPNGEVEDYAVTIFGLAVLNTAKTSQVYEVSPTNRLALPGNDILYTITTSNVGTGPVDSNSVIVIDLLPTILQFYNGDIDDAGPLTGAVSFTQTGSALTFTPATDLRYSNIAATPSSFAACTYTPAAGYDAAVKHICVNPKGSMAAGGNFALQLRARIP